MWHSGRCDSIPTHILLGQSPFHTPMATSAIFTISLTEAYDLKSRHSVPMHQVTLLITDMHSRSQSLPETSCRFEAVERYPRFGRFETSTLPEGSYLKAVARLVWQRAFQKLLELMAGIFSKRVTWQCSWAVKYITVDHGMGRLWKSQLHDRVRKIFEMKFQWAVHQVRMSYSMSLSRDYKPTTLKGKTNQHNNSLIPSQSFLECLQTLN
jgi:hypothetical protein